MIFQAYIKNKYKYPSQSPRFSELYDCDEESYSKNNEDSFSSKPKVEERNIPDESTNLKNPKSYGFNYDNGENDKNFSSLEPVNDCLKGEEKNHINGKKEWNNIQEINLHEDISVSDTKKNKKKKSKTTETKTFKKSNYIVRFRTAVNRFYIKRINTAIQSIGLPKNKIIHTPSFQEFSESVPHEKVYQEFDQPMKNFLIGEYIKIDNKKEDKFKQLKKLDKNADLIKDIESLDSLYAKEAIDLINIKYRRIIEIFVDPKKLNEFKDYEVFKDSKDIYEFPEFIKFKKKEEEKYKYNYDEKFGKYDFIEDYEKRMLGKKRNK